VAGLDNALRALRLLQSPAVDPERLREIAAAVASDHRLRALDEAAAKSLMAAYGVSVPEGRIACAVDDAVSAARDLGYPVVLKVLAEGVIHKSDIGGVVVGVEADIDVAREAGRILGLAPRARVLVESMAAAGVELIVAARREGVVPTLTVGLGGIWTEAFADVACIPLPASPARIRSALEGLRAWALLEGARGRAAYDVEGLCEAAGRIGDLLLAEGLTLIEVNPLIVSESGCVAVDAVVTE
jgi:succinyl-CoA synthetase beta subunit